MTPVLPTHLAAYFDVQVVGSSLRVKCKNGHIAAARMNREDEGLAELGRAHPDCRFCKKVLGTATADE